MRRFASRIPGSYSAVEFMRRGTSTYAPEDPHETLKRHLSDVTKRMGAIEQRLVSDSGRLLATCARAYMAEAYGGNYTVNQGDYDFAITMCTAKGFGNTAFLSKYNNLDVPFGP